MSHEILTEKSFERPSNQPKAAPRIVKFVNFSNEDFTYTWNKVAYTFPAGQFRFMETNIANHFAKHLINRELLKAGRENDTSPKKPEENMFYMELYKKTIEPVISNPVADQTAIEQEVIDRDMRAKLGLAQPTAPMAPEAPAPTQIAPESQSVDPTAPAAEGEFELVDVDDEEEKDPEIPSNVAAQVSAQQK